MAVRIKLYGLKETRRNFRRLHQKVRNIDNGPFATRMAQYARDRLEETREGWPNFRNLQHITFDVKAKKQANGATVQLEASAIGKGGFDYTQIQEEGYPRSRRSKSGEHMRFMTPRGSWVSKKVVKAIPAKRFMEKTALWAETEYPRYIERKVAEAIQQSMKKTRG
ncbi:MAG: hypothetical protein WC451_02555 [Patescibacteria group bacterium]